MEKSSSVPTFKPIINAGAKVRSPQTNYLKHYGTFPGGLRHFGEERKKEGEREEEEMEENRKH